MLDKIYAALGSFARLRNVINIFEQLNSILQDEQFDRAKKLEFIDQFIEECRQMKAKIK